MQHIFGQSRAIHVLQSVLRSGRIHHAWTFAGPRGVGKFTAAVQFARLLLDPDAQPTLTGEIASDPDSHTSQLIDTRSHPDLHVIRKELALYSSDPKLRNRKLLNIPLDVLREWMIGGKGEDGGQAPVYRTPALGHRKVFIIDEAELLDQYSQNAILKTLEEPPRQTYLVLVTCRPDRLLPTIRSRCQIVRFNRLDAEAMHAWFEQSDLQLKQSERAWIEHFADGSPGLATLAADYGFHEWWTTIEPMLRDLERGTYPATLGETLARQIDDFAGAWVKQKQNASKDAANKDGAQHMLTILADFARRRLIESAQGGDDVDRWHEATDLIREAERELYANVNLKLLLENLVVQWCDRMNRAVAA